MLIFIYARYGSDASKLKRPHATIVQWRIAMDNALRNGPDVLLANCRIRESQHEGGLKLMAHSSDVMFRRRVPARPAPLRTPPHTPLFLPLLPDPAWASSPPPGQDGVEGTLVAFGALLEELHYRSRRFS